MSNSRLIFVNLPITDLAASIAFYESIGGTMEPKFSNEMAAMIKFSDVIHVMLLTHEFYKGFTIKPIADAHRTSEVLICISAENRAAVDSIIDQAVAAGGKGDPSPKQEMSEMMYGRSFEDLDGHHWEVMWMAPQAAEQGAAAIELATA